MASSRRRFRRTPVLLSGRFYRGPESVGCVITNLSAGGARIKAVDGSAAGLPADRQGTTALVIERYGVFQGKLMWQDGETAGIRFLHTPKLVRDAISPRLAA